MILFIVGKVQFKYTFVYMEIRNHGYIKRFEHIWKYWFSFTGYYIFQIIPMKFVTASLKMIANKDTIADFQYPFTIHNKKNELYIYI